MKNYYFDSEIENAKKLIKLEIDAHKKAVKLIDAVKPVIIKNDGKRADKRFINQLQAVYDGMNIKINTSLYNKADINIIFYIK